jgi:hypothetical protein
MRVRLLPEAEKELLEAAKWYSEQSVGNLCAVLMKPRQR